VRKKKQIENNIYPLETIAIDKNTKHTFKCQYTLIGYIGIFIKFIIDKKIKKANKKKNGKSLKDISAEI